MLSLPNSTRVFLHREPVDFRKAHDGLCGVVRAGLGHDPLSGDLFVFLNRRRNRVKLLQWDGAEWDKIASEARDTCNDI